MTLSVAVTVTLTAPEVQAVLAATTPAAGSTVRQGDDGFVEMLYWALPERPPAAAVTVVIAALALPAETAVGAVLVNARAS
jgi:hypothetical protein